MGVAEVTDDLQLRTTDIYYKPQEFLAVCTPSSPFPSPQFSRTCPVGVQTERFGNRDASSWPGKTLPQTCHVACMWVQPAASLSRRKRPPCNPKCSARATIVTLALTCSRGRRRRFWRERRTLRTSSTAARWSARAAPSSATRSQRPARPTRLPNNSKTTSISAGRGRRQLCFCLKPFGSRSIVKRQLLSAMRVTVSAHLKACQ